MREFLLYIMEVGERHFIKARGKSKDAQETAFQNYFKNDPSKRYFGLSGVIIEKSNLQSFGHSFRKAVLEQYQVGTRAFMLGKNDLVKKKYSTILENICDFLGREEFVFINVGVDKKELYTECKEVYDAHPYCFPYVLQKYSDFLSGIEAVGEVCTVAKTRELKRRMTSVFRKTVKGGMFKIEPEYIKNHVKDITVLKTFLSRHLRKDDISGLAIANYIGKPLLDKNFNLTPGRVNKMILESLEERGFSKSVVKHEFGFSIKIISS